MHISGIAGSDPFATPHGLPPHSGAPATSLLAASGAAAGSASTLAPAPRPEPTPGGAGAAAAVNDSLETTFDQDFRIFANAVAEALGRADGFEDAASARAWFVDPSSENDLERVQKLNLDCKGLTTLPPEIGQLVNLEVLWLRNNALTDLPDEIWQLANLKVLALQDNELTDLPDEIWQLANLEMLGLQNNALTDLPPGIGQLARLERLYLGNNALTELPGEVWELPDLKTITLFGNKLAGIPPESQIRPVTRQSAKRGFDLIKNPDQVFLNFANELAKRLGRHPFGDPLSARAWFIHPSTKEALGKIQTLDLSECNLHYLPPEIREFVNLRELDLSMNHLHELPGEMAELDNLKSLNLSQNDLVDHISRTDFSLIFQGLTKLKKLDLSFNIFEYLPPEIARLNNLEELNLEGVALFEPLNLPPEIGELPALTSINLEGNPLERLPTNLAPEKVIGISAEEVARLQAAAGAGATAAAPQETAPRAQSGGGPCSFGSCTVI